MKGKRVQEIEEQQRLDNLRQIYMKKELEFIKRCEANGYKRTEIPSDGNCVFQSVCDQLYSRNYHIQIRQVVCDYIDLFKDQFRLFIIHKDGGLIKYLEDMRKEGTWAGDIELQAIAELYDIRIEIYEYTDEPVKVFNETASQKNKIVRLLYLQKSHYDSLHKLSEPATVL